MCKAGLLILTASLAAACGDPITVEFALQATGEPISCGTPFSMDGIDMELTDARMYVSQMVLLDTYDTYNQLRFDRDDTWQHDEIALLDFEDGTGACEGGTSEMHTTLTGETRAREIVELGFLLGVPTYLNAPDLSEQEAPLDVADMHTGEDGHLHAGRRPASRRGSLDRAPARHRLRVQQCRCGLRARQPRPGLHPVHRRTDGGARSRRAADRRRSSRRGRGRGL